MKFKFSHDGETYEMDTDSLSVIEARIVKQYAGMSVGEWHEGLVKMDVDAVVALVFTAKRRAGVELEWSDLDDMDLMVLMESIAEDNDLDLDAIRRGETPTLPAALNRADRRAEVKSGASKNGTAPKPRAPRRVAAR